MKSFTPGLLAVSATDLGLAWSAPAADFAILGGGAGKLKGGRILDYRGKPHRQMCSLFLSLMDKFDIRLDRFGDSDSRLEEV